MEGVLLNQCHAARGQQHDIGVDAISNIFNATN